MRDAGQLVMWAARAVTARQQDGERLLAHARRLTEAEPEKREEYEDYARVSVDGEPYFLTRQLVGLVDVGRASVPDWPLQPHDVISPTGYVLLEQPIDLTVTPSGISTCIRSLTWRTESVTRRPEKYPNGVLDTCWFSEAEPFTGSLWWGFGRTAAESLVIEVEDERRQRPGSNDRYTAWSASVTPVLQALLACLKQQITAIDRVRPDRAARKLVERAQRPPRDVNIVSLRRAESRHSEPTSELEIDWAARWWVRGHWRRQPCGRGLGDRRPVLIASYIKGPEDKPLTPLRPRRFVAHR